jgi:WD40 repeat protein
MKKLFILIFSFAATIAFAQQNFTPEMLWKLGRISALGISKDNKYVIYNVSVPDVDANRLYAKTYKIPVEGGTPVEIDNASEELNDNRISPNGKYVLGSQSVKMKKVLGTDIYPDLPKTTARVYTSLNYRHWDEWFDGEYNHVFVGPNLKKYDSNTVSTLDIQAPKDIMPNDNNSCPQEPFGGNEDFIWNPDSERIIYVTKKAFGTAYTISTNTDLFEYDINTGITKNLTAYNKGYDVAPAFNKDGTLAWLQMKRDGYEADKQDLVIMHWDTPPVSLTAHADSIHVESFKWSNDGKSLFFIAPVDGTLQVFEVKSSNLIMPPPIKQITKGDFDINEIIGQVENKLIVTKNDIAHPADIYSVDINTEIGRAHV